MKNVICLQINFWCIFEITENAKRSVFFFVFPKTFFENWLDISIFQNEWKFYFSNGFIQKIKNIFCK